MTTPGEIVEAVGSASNAASSFFGIIETFYRPYGLIREAKAAAAAAIIRAEGDDVAALIRERTAGRFLSRELRRQENIDTVVERAARLLPPGAKLHAPDEDWMSRFFSDAGDVSEAQLGELFSRILSNEVRRPGCCSRRTLTVLRDLQTIEAARFQAIAAHAWFFQEESAILLTVDASAGGVKFSEIYSLTDAGLIVADGLSLRVDIGNSMRFHGHDFRVSLRENLQSADVFVWPLTEAGTQLARVCALTEPHGALEAGRAALDAQYVELTEVLA